MLTWWFSLKKIEFLPVSNLKWVCHIIIVVRYYWMLKTKTLYKGYIWAEPFKNLLLKNIDYMCVHLNEFSLSYIILSAEKCFISSWFKGPPCNVIYSWWNVWGWVILSVSFSDIKISVVVPVLFSEEENYCL